VENAEKREIELEMKAKNGELQTENDNLKVSQYRIIFNFKNNLKIQHMTLEMELNTTVKNIYF